MTYVHTVRALSYFLCFSTTQFYPSCLSYWQQNKTKHNKPWCPWASYQIRGLRMHRECRKRFPRHRLQKKPLVSGPGMHHGTCVTHVPWCKSESLACGGGENVPGIPGACATRNFTYLVRGPWCMEYTAFNQNHPYPPTWTHYSAAMLFNITEYC